MAKMPSQYRAGWPEENAVYRARARKPHRCEGNGSPDEHAADCQLLIKVGEPYVEYLDGPLYARGTSHSIACALKFEYIVAAGSVK